MNDLEAIQEQVIKSLQQQLGSTNINYWSAKNTIDKSLGWDYGDCKVSLQHDSKKWPGRVADWFKWKTPLRKWFSYEWRKLDYVTEHDVRAFYIDRLKRTGNYRIKRNKIYVKFLISNPYHTFDVNYDLKIQKPVEYIKIDFEVRDGR